MFLIQFSYMSNSLMCPHGSTLIVVEIQLLHLQGSFANKLLFFRKVLHVTILLVWTHRKEDVSSKINIILTEQRCTLQVRYTRLRTKISMYISVCNYSLQFDVSS